MQFNSTLPAEEMFQPQCIDKSADSLLSVTSAKQFSRLYPACRFKSASGLAPAD
ncbi:MULTISPECIES: hypothetical protein [Rhizobium]|uniref:hypothetical protein n=1 Tax=Rhizobium TaxID=379 RepID=UPI00234EF0C1|nr:MULTISPECIES: hypothetical protein [unclassified Rhizobium]MDC7741189.1 hypothetical protein [Rhizobium sp. BC56]MDC9810828.1 hypothetical protein [Rhizobium sp. MC62]WEA59035.1 hypothetical protein PO860_15270 [Rhizobium sp. BJ04]